MPLSGRVDSVYVQDFFEADGPDEVRKAARQCIKLGVDWIKLFITGGIAGARESMYEIQMSPDEIKAACDVAHNKGLKVCAHTGCSEAAKIGVRAGLDCIEHGYELDQEACELMAEYGVYYCPTLSVTQDEAYMRRLGVAGIFYSACSRRGRTAPPVIPTGAQSRGQNRQRGGPQSHCRNCRAGDRVGG